MHVDEGSPLKEEIDSITGRRLRGNSGSTPGYSPRLRGSKPNIGVTSAASNGENPLLKRKSNDSSVTAGASSRHRGPGVGLPDMSGVVEGNKNPNIVELGSMDDKEKIELPLRGENPRGNGVA